MLFTAARKILLASNPNFDRSRESISFILFCSGIFFSDLKSSKCSYVVEPRLLRFWDARNVKCGDLYSIIDEACWAVDLVSLSGQVTWGSPSNPNSARSKNLRSSPLFVRPP
ncbi:hypothetical protein YC2023_090999 [Brassica napus]